MYNFLIFWDDNSWMKLMIELKVLRIDILFIMEYKRKKIV